LRRVSRAVGGAHKSPSCNAVERCWCRRKQRCLAVVSRAVARWRYPQPQRCQAVPVPVPTKAEEPPRRCAACRCALAVPTVTTLSSGAGAGTGEGRRAATPLCRVPLRVGGAHRHTAVKRCRCLRR
jgi:hypothetical protein